MAQKKTNHTKRNAAIGAAALAATAAGAAAGYYFYMSKDAKENRRVASKWARDMKNEVVREAKKAGDISRADMVSIIDKAAAAYQSARNVDPADLKRAASELRANWSAVLNEARSDVRRNASSAKKTVKSAKKATKKTAKKAARRSR